MTSLYPSPGDEVLRPGVMADECRGRLLRLVLEVFAERHADPLGIEQLGDLGVVLEVGARRIAPRVPPTAVLLPEQTGERGAVLAGEPPLLADAAVPVLGQRLGHLDTEAMQEQIV